jgi:hypothetical protein
LRICFNNNQIGGNNKRLRQLLPPFQRFLVPQILQIVWFANNIILKSTKGRIILIVFKFILHFILTSLQVVSLSSFIVLKKQNTSCQ